MGPAPSSADGDARPATDGDPGPGDPARSRLASALADLTPAQRRAVEAPAGPLSIVAGAGSGKTRVLTLRVARRVTEHPGEADHTAVCTFTRKAATELRSRLHSYGLPVAAPATGGAATTPPTGIRAGTLHQLALSLVRRHAQDAGRTPPAVVDQRSRVLADVVADRSALAALEQEIGWAKARCLGPDTYAAAAHEAGRRPGVDVQEVAGAFAAYQQALARRHALDLDDVLLVAAARIEEDAAFAEAVRWRYRHLSVDEFQDVNPAQFRLVAALAGDRWDVCVVGDPNQAIYGWNGADPTLLGRLPELVPGLRVVELADNHRSTPEVVRAAAAVLGPGSPLPPRSVADSGPLPVVTTYDDADEEARGVAALLMAEHDEGTPWRQLAVLARTHDQLAVVRRALSRAGVPVVVAPGPEAVGTERRGGDGPDPGSGEGTGARDAVELATFHRAKGLEWRSVCVVGLEDGYVPVVHAASPAAVAEERRLLYVALSRASERLWCSWARSRRTGSGRASPREPSPWLASISRCARTGTARSGTAPSADAATNIARLRARLRA